MRCLTRCINKETPNKNAGTRLKLEILLESGMLKCLFGGGARVPPLYPCDLSVRLSFALLLVCSCGGKLFTECFCIFLCE